MISSSSSAFKSIYSPEYAFVSLVDCKDKFPLVKKVFDNVMAPIYGEQAELLKDIEKRKDRKTEILTHNGKDVGCIVYKRNLIKSDVSDTFEVSLISLFDAANDTMKGYRTKLVERIEEIAKDLGASSISCTLPEQLAEQVKYLVHKKFEKQDLLQQGNVKECLLTKKIENKRRKVEEPQQLPATPRPAPAPVAPRQNELTLKNQYIDPIRRGVKTIEGRINSGAPRNFRVGETLRLFSGNNSVTSTIVKIEKFASFKEMLEKTDYKKCIPEARDLAAAIKVYDDIPGYAGRAKQHGVLAIHLANPK